MEEIRVDVEEIMSEIRRKIRSEGKLDLEQVMKEISDEVSRQENAPLPSFSGEPIPSGGSGDLSPLARQNLNETQYLKNHAVIPFFREMGGGLKGLVKRVIRKCVKCVVLPMREEQDAYNLHTANSVDGLRIATEQLSEELQALSAVAADLEMQKESLKQLREETAAEQAELQRRITAAEKASDELSLSVAGFFRQTAEAGSSKTPALAEGKTEKAGKPEKAAAPAAAQPEDGYHAIDYFKFENNFRGTQNEIMERQKIYLPYFRNRSGRIYDLGCGRGEFLRLLKEENIPAFGVDMYPEYTVTGKLYGIDIQQGDGIALLESTEEKFGGIFCAQVIEHIGFANIEKLCKLAYDRLEEDAVLVLETPNPMCVSAMTNAFYLDPTHDKPVHPLMMQYLLESIGFREVQLLWPDHSLERLPHFESDAIKNLDQVNRAMDRLSDLLFGSQDYAVIGKK